MVATPVIDHIIPVPVLRRKAIPPVECVVWAYAAFAPPPIVVATIIAVCALYLVFATSIVAIAAILSEGNSSRSQGHRQDRGNNCFSFHVDLHLIEICANLLRAICRNHIAMLMPACSKYRCACVTDVTRCMSQVQARLLSAKELDVP